MGNTGFLMCKEKLREYLRKISEMIAIFLGVRFGRLTDSKSDRSIESKIDRMNARETRSAKKTTTPTTPTATIKQFEVHT